ncbi:MAG TPA: hypothetical protein VK427_02545, partial [Kofleriaceae bacterium]|nr:hypothetical protein [Kofleriaceae bacterium]
MKIQTWLCSAVTLAWFGCAVTDDEGTTSQASNVNGKKLYEEETFAGNGRTCLVCHGAQTGTVSPAEAQARFAANPNDPLFRAIDSDDGVD